MSYNMDSGFDEHYFTFIYVLTNQIEILEFAYLYGANKR